MNKWHKVSECLPEKEGQYLCLLEGFNCFTYSIPYYHLFWYTNDAYKLDKYDFQEYKGKKKKSLFYAYSSEWGYIERDDVYAWMEIPEYEGE